MLRPLPLLTSMLLLAVACGDAIESQEAESNPVWKGAAEGSCEAEAMLAFANEATLEALDVDAGLDKRAAENIVAERPFETLGELDAVPQVGHAALDRILAHVGEAGGLTDCTRDELGVVSDLDLTVVPKAEPDLSKAPYPGVAALYTLLETRGGGATGDVVYVTAREPEDVAEMPDYLREHGVPAGVIETGTSGMPWIAEPEKVKDVKAVLGRTGAQRFVLFGDSSHRDPEVYKRVLADHPDRIAAGLIHQVTTSISPSRVTGLYVHENYAEAAAILAGLELITEGEAREVWQAAVEEGLTVDEPAMTAYLEEHAR